MQNDAMTLLKKQIEDERQALTDALADGCAKDFPDYRGIVGRIYGLMLACKIVSEMEARLQKSEE